MIIVQDLALRTPAAAAPMTVYVHLSASALLTTDRNSVTDAHVQCNEF